MNINGSLEYTRLIINTVNELLSIVQLIVTAPKLIYEELFERSDIKRNAIQSVSVCGRKAVSWTKPISVAQLVKFSKRQSSGTTITECKFDGTSHAIHALLEQYKDVLVPSQCKVYARSVPYDYLLGKQEFLGGNFIYKQNYCAKSIFFLYC